MNIFVIIFSKNFEIQSIKTTIEIKKKKLNIPSNVLPFSFAFTEPVVRRMPIFHLIELNLSFAFTETSSPQR